ncbi:MAG: type 4a pilus biogenesis protein PilO [Candidatus Omnitrophota bacterium]
MPKIDFKNLGKGNLLKSKREIYLLTLFILVIFFRFVIPKDIRKIRLNQEKNFSKQEELNRKRTELFSVEGLVKDQERYNEEYNQLLRTAEAMEKEIENLKNALIDKDKLAEVLNYLTSSANPEEIEFNLITMGSVVEYDNYNELPVKMKINAHFFSFMEYIKNLESLPFLIETKKLKINSPETDGRVNAEAELVVYVSK